jgi:predicted amidohydrolase
MNRSRIALANLRIPATREEAVALAEEAIAEASVAGADLIAFPECFVPGYRVATRGVLPPDPRFLERAWSTLAAACAKASVAAVVGTERVVDGALRITALVIDADGTTAGVQDKVQLDPSEDGTYAPGSGRRVFHAGPLTFGAEYREN